MGVASCGQGLDTAWGVPWGALVGALGGALVGALGAVTYTAWGAF